MIVNIVLNPFTVSCVFPCTPWYRVIYILLFRCYYCFIANEAIGDVTEIGAKQYKYIHTTYIESNDIWHYTINIEFQYILITPHQFTSIKTYKKYNENTFIKVYKHKKGYFNGLYTFSPPW